MTYRKKLTLSFFLILSFQTLLSIGLTYFSISELLRGQNRTILEEGWNQQVTRFNDIFKQITKDLYFYKFLIEKDILGHNSLENVDQLLEKCLDNTVAHTTILYDSEGVILISKKDGQQPKNFNILNSPYSLLDFKFPNTRISWSNKEDIYDYFGLISGTRIISGDEIYYLIFFTDFRQHLQQISERQPEVLTVFSLEDRILYSDFPGVKPFAPGEKEWGETNIGNDSFMVYGQSIWSNKSSTVTLSVLHTITAEKKLLNTLIRMTAYIFFFTWIIAFIIALWISRIFSIPLLSLNNSLKTYLADGFFPRIEYRKENEFSFLIRTFENLSEKIVFEEKQIRSQMEEIEVLNDYNRNLIENMKSGIVVLSYKGTVEFCNTFFSRTINRDYEEIIGSDYRELLDDVFDIDIPGLDTITNFSIIPGIHLLSRMQSQKIYSLRISPVYSSDHLEKILLMLEDTTVSDRKWEESLLMDRISSLSILSAGMAHEINNPLASIQTNIDFLGTIEDDPVKKDSIKWITDGVSRISSIVTDTAQYTMSSHRSITENVAATTEKTAQLLMSSKVKKDIPIRVLWSNPIPSVSLQEDLFKQLILNLLLNSIDACSPGDSILVNFSYEEDEDIVTMSIIDTGRGIPEDKISKVFNPFFSYGKETKGTGLGLSVCYGIVSRAGGKITLESVKGQGTTVTVEMKIYENSHS